MTRRLSSIRAIITTTTTTTTTAIATANRTNRCAVLIHRHHHCYRNNYTTAAAAAARAVRVANVMPSAPSAPSVPALSLSPLKRVCAYARFYFPLCATHTQTVHIPTYAYAHTWQVLFCTRAQSRPRAKSVGCELPQSARNSCI